MKEERKGIYRLRLKPVYSNASFWEDRKTMVREIEQCFDLSDDGRVYERRDGHMILRECYIKAISHENVEAFCGEMKEWYSMEIRWNRHEL